MSPPDKKPDAWEDDATTVHRGRERVGRYEIHDKLGTGGMAAVYLGRQLGESGFKRWVAVKRIHDHLAVEAQFRDMFLDEARTAARLLHSNLVHVTDLGLEEGRPYIVMEYVDGQTLAAVLRECRENDRGLPLSIAARIVAQACEGLHFAHELRQDNGERLDLVHRDVSPQNILVSYEGAVKVTDFGIAKAAGRLAHTKPGHIKGKFGYMSPEQARARHLDARSDIFCLGIVLYEATLNRRFATGSEIQALEKIICAQVTPPRSISSTFPAELEEIILRALSLFPRDRYQTAREMGQDLEEFLARTGQPWGATQLSALMAELFPDRKSAAPDLAPPEVEPDPPEPPTMVRRTETDGIDTQEVPPGDEEPEQRRSVFWVAIAFSLAALIFAGGFGAWIGLRSMVPSGASPSVDGQGQVVSGAGVDRSAELDTLRRVEAGAPEARLEQDAGAAAQETSTFEISVAGADASLFDGPSSELDAEQAAPPSTVKQRSGRRRRGRGRQTEPTGTLSVLATPWCVVSLGGRRLGSTPLMGVQVPTGRHVLTLLPRGQPPRKRRVVTVRPGEPTHLNLRFPD